MQRFPLRSATLALAAVLTLTAAGCGVDPSTTAVPVSHQNVATADPSAAPATPASAAVEPTPDPTEPGVPAPQVQALTQVTFGTTTGSATSARHNPPPPGSVDCSVAKCIALTFDDGPGPYTPRLLEMLTSKGAGATFFMQGVMIRANPDIARQVASTPRMEIGDHSMTHPQLNRVSAGKLRNELAGNHALIKEVTGKDVTVFRPPYGARNGAVDAMAAEVGESVIIWDVDTNDWKTRNAVSVRAEVARQARPGSIVLMHDIHKSTVDAVPGIISDLQAQGYVLVTVSEVLGGSTPGQVYNRR
ncbi:MAG: polysaccharide deacetylase family protein [Propionibacteriaceae bacterium]|nr:polysaccharide deacetylase family protein [Propionibacteriaceae bacterium]